MRLPLFLFLAFFTSSIIGQVQPKALAGIKLAKKKRFSMEGETPAVSYLKNQRISQDTRCILNGEVVAMQTLEALNPDQIAEVRVEKDKNTTELYNGTIFITTKEDYQPKFISVEALLSKYLDDLKATDKKIVFLNNKVVHEDFKVFMVDERYVLKIEVEQVVDPSQDLDIWIINLIPRTKENVEKANTIILRGASSER